MRQLTYILTIFVGLFSACNTTDSGTNSTSRLLPEPDINERLKYQKALIDTFYNHNKDKVKILVKLVDKDELVEEINNEFDEISCEKTFWILKDSLNKIITIFEQPFSESGDWNIVLTHYFDKDGNTFAFERQTNFFNSICTDDVAYETRTEFYSNDFKLIDKMYKLVDKNNKPLQKDSCQFPYDYEFKISPDLDKYLQTNRIKNSK
jgi:hypothetical protein